MIDLRNYYLSNINENDYYYRFFELVVDINKTYNIFEGERITKDYRFEVFDEDEAIAKFRLLCQPGSDPHSAEEKCWFFLVSYFLNTRGYVIDQFPNVLSRPPDEPSKFTYGDIRDNAFLRGLNDGNTVRYAIRRQIVAEMTFTRKGSAVNIEDDLNQIVQRLSVRNARFEEMELDEKLREIANLIEGLLKVNGRFINLDYPKMMFDYVDNESIKKFRKQLQCFRHSDAHALKERSSITEDQKEFLVDYGVTICKAVYRLRSLEDETWE